MSLQRDVLIFGGIIVDRYIVVDEYPLPGQDAVIRDVFEVVGGCAVNVAFTLNNLNCRPYIVAAVGSDERGRLVQDYLAKHRMATSCIKKVPDRSSGYCMTILDQSGERTFLTQKGCEDEFSSGMVADRFYQKGPFVYVTGYYLLSDAFSGEILKVVKRLKQSGSVILFDPGPLSDRIGRDDLLTMFQLADVVTPNTDEVHKIMKQLHINKPFQTWCFDVGVNTVIIKKGDHGAHVVSRENAYHLPSYTAKSLDTSGAGDSFAGGFIAGLAHEYDLEMCTKIAAATGAITTTIEGPHGAFTWDDVMDTIAKEKVIKR